MITAVMDLEDAKDDAADADELCNDVCPFGIKKCVDVCKQLMETIGTCNMYFRLHDTCVCSWRMQMLC